MDINRISFDHFQLLCSIPISDWLWKWLLDYSYIIWTIFDQFRPLYHFSVHIDPIVDYFWPFLFFSFKHSWLAMTIFWPISTIFHYLWLSSIHAYPLCGTEKKHRDFESLPWRWWCHHQTGLDLCNEEEVVGGGFLDVPSLITLKHPTLFIFSYVNDQHGS